MAIGYEDGAPVRVQFPERSKLVATTTPPEVRALLISGIDEIDVVTTASVVPPKSSRMIVEFAGLVIVPLVPVLMIANLVVLTYFPSDIAAPPPEDADINLKLILGTGQQAYCP